jgi:hypothetical protein
MKEMISGVAFGGLISWLITHKYFRKQEQTNPTPLIQEIG